jgi:hypothetical protein
MAGDVDVDSSPCVRNTRSCEFGAGGSKAGWARRIRHLYSFPKPSVWTRVLERISGKMFFITTLLFLLTAVFASGHYLKPVIERASLLRSRELIQQGLQLQLSVPLLYGEGKCTLSMFITYFSC